MSGCRLTIDMSNISLERSAASMILLTLFAHVISFHSRPCCGARPGGIDVVADSASEEIVVIGSPDANGTIVVGYLMDQVDPPYRIGALSMSIENGIANGLLDKFNFRCVIRVTW